MRYLSRELFRSITERFGAAVTVIEVRFTCMSFSLNQITETGTKTLYHVRVFVRITSQVYSSQIDRLQQGLLVRQGNW